MLDVPPPDHHLPMPRDRLERFRTALLAERGHGLEGARVLGDGYLSTAYLLADGFTVARIPKFEGAVPDLEFELGVLPVLADAGLSFETPRDARPLRDSQGLVATLHRLVVGTSLKPRVEELRATGGWQGLAQDLGRFLTTLHAIPSQRFEGLRADRWWRLAERWIADSRPALDGRGNAWIDDRLARLRDLARPTSVPDVFTHGDLWPSNILIDESGRLAGIIDFGLAAVIDPAWDLRSLSRPLGPDFETAVLEAYDGPLDEHALQRAKVLLDLDELGDLAYELTVIGRRGQSFESVQRLIAEWDDSS